MTTTRHPSIVCAPGARHAGALTPTGSTGVTIRLPARPQNSMQHMRHAARRHAPWLQWSDALLLLDTVMKSCASSAGESGAATFSGPGKMFSVSPAKLNSVCHWLSAPLRLAVTLMVIAPLAVLVGTIVMTLADDCALSSSSSRTGNTNPCSDLTTPGSRLTSQGVAAAPVSVMTLPASVEKRNSCVQ
jgi:hypothetical protein